ncbi:MAG: DEAD/DEAH box helicase [Candidatus Saccharimonadales bacterium]
MERSEGRKSCSTVEGVFSRVDHLTPKTHCVEEIFYVKNLPETGNRLNIEAENNLLRWQSECLEEIKNERNVILSSPTGSGKTRVFLEWANIKKAEAKNNSIKHTIYITAPVKALSNQRFRELSKQGYNVGLETGDIKKVPDKADYICCTQEIYTNKYLNDEDASLIMDEFHYIFEDSNRARTYIDSLHTSKARNILLASATLGDTAHLKGYVDKVSGRGAYNYENKERITELDYKGVIDPENIRDALVVTFSAKNCRDIAGSLFHKRENKDEKEIAVINEIAAKMKVQNEDILLLCKRGLSYYYGALLPKEKLMIEQLFEKRLIDVVIGTDALALGVNFPVEKVVFAQLAKYYDGPISKNLFEQLSGRAGRKGYFDKGEVYFCNFGVENKEFSIDKLFKWNLERDNENATISLKPNIKELLLGKATPMEEARFICKFSTEDFKETEIIKQIAETVEYIQTYKPLDAFEMIKYANNPPKPESIEKIGIEFKKNIAKVYFDEFDPMQNCEIFSWILMGKTTEEIVSTFSNNFSDLLRFRKYFRHLPKEYRKTIDFYRLEQKINSIDDTALNIGRTILS